MAHSEVDDSSGRVITEQLNLTTPASWNLSLPTYQLTQTYTDADQPQTTQTSAINGQGQSTPQYTFTNVYDSTLGVLTGLSSTTASQSNLASLSFTSNGLLGAFNDVSSAGLGSQLATESFSYDGDLRPTEETATWQSGSGSSGTFFDEARGYDAASNVDTVTTTLSQPNGQSGSNSMGQNFCYTEQDQLVWAGNSGTQPGAGNGTCGGGTLANTFSGGSYSSAFAYTHLGQLWQGPLNGTGANEQYLYCTSSQPHQLTDLVPAGQNYSCSNLPQSIPYTLAYNSWGDAKSRATSAGTATLSSNDFDQLVEWHIPSTNQAWYGYDASGTRTVQHTTVGSTSSTTIYAFGLEEYSYDGSGNLLSSTHYYSLAGHLLGELQTSGSTSTTNFFLTDGLGSVLGVFSDTANSAALLSTQLFTPYGTQLVANGNSLGQYTVKGFTGQYSDTVSGLDYYVSRYYDPVAGVFLSADKATGNAQGMNPYDYVGNNPETANDPTGNYYSNGTSTQQHGGATAYVSGNVITTVTNDGYGTYWSLSGQETWNPYGGLSIDSSTTQQITIYGGYNPNTDARNSPWQKFLGVTGWTQLQQSWNAPGATTWDRLKAIGNFALTNANNLLQLAAIFGGPEDEGIAATADETISTVVKVVTDVGEPIAKNEVLLDTNAIFNYRSIVNQGVIDLTKEEPVISQTVADELTDVVSRGGLRQPGIANSLRIVPDAASDETKAAVLQALESFGPVKTQGQAQDLVIAATALDTGRPLVTSDQMMFNAIKLLDESFDVRLFR